MSEWVDIENRKPNCRFVWVLILGRMENDGYRDTEIIRMIYNNEEFRTLDYARAIYLSSEVVADFDKIIAWMPINNMSFPSWIIDKLEDYQDLTEPPQNDSDLREQYNKLMRGRLNTLEKFPIEGEFIVLLDMIVKKLDKSEI